MKTPLFAALALLALPLLALGVPAHAQRQSDTTGEQLAKLCTSRDARQLEGCTAYISGIADAAGLFQDLRPADGSKGAALPGYVCIPAKATGVQLRQAFVEWLRKHPDRNSQQAGHAVLVALDETFPCSGTRA